MPKESTQHKLDRVRPPRVQITYDVETGDAIEMKDLPFVAGIMADLSGKPEKPLPKVKDRKFVNIDRDTFHEVLEKSKPRLAFRVDNKLQDDDTKLNVELKFKSIEDFEPANVVNQVEPMRKLFEARKRLSDLLAKLDGNDELDALLQDITANTESLQKIKEDAQKAAESEGGEAEAAPAAEDKPESPEGGGDK
jgi:type VI secretion system protein ImpB